MSGRVFVTEAEAVREDFKGRTNHWVCRPDLVEAKGLQICRAVLPVGEGHAFHRHPELEEVIYILTGEVEQWVEKEKRVLRPGEIAHIPVGVVHASFNVGAGEAVLLAIFSPATQAGPLAVDVSDQEPWKSLRQ